MERQTPVDYHIGKHVTELSFFHFFFNTTQLSFEETIEYAEKIIFLLTYILQMKLLPKVKVLGAEELISL